MDMKDNYFWCYCDDVPTKVKEVVSRDEYGSWSVDYYKDNNNEHIQNHLIDYEIKSRTKKDLIASHKEFEIIKTKTLLQAAKESVKKYSKLLKSLQGLK